MRRIFSIILAIIGLAALFLAAIYLKYNISNQLNGGTGPTSWLLAVKILTVAILIFFATYWLWNSVESVAKRAARLKKSGHFIMAKFVRIRNPVDEGIAALQIKGVPGVVVEASYLETRNSQLRSFFSPTVWELPTPMPPEIKVYVNPKDLSDYHMDIGLTLAELLQQHKANMTKQSKR